MANWIPPVYPFAIRNAYSLQELREILRMFQLRFPFSHLPDRVNLWPRNLEEQLIADLELSVGEGEELRRIGRQHEATRVFLFQEMVRRIRSSDEEREQERRRVMDLEEYERNRRSWFRQRLASRRRRHELRKQRQEAWIAMHFWRFQFEGGPEIFVPVFLISFLMGYYAKPSTTY